MTSLLQDIRGALQLQLDQVSGFPPAAQRAYEGRAFVPTIGTAWAKLTLMTNSRRPFSLNGASQITGGLFQVDVFHPAKGGPGSAPIDVLMDAVADAYPLDTSLFRGSTRVWINYAQPGTLSPEPDWLHGVVTVSWRCFKTS